jgi:hypothetical protein
MREFDGALNDSAPECAMLCCGFQSIASLSSFQSLKMRNRPALIAVNALRAIYCSQFKNGEITLQGRRSEMSNFLLVT